MLVGHEASLHSKNKAQQHKKNANKPKQRLIKNKRKTVKEAIHQGLRDLVDVAYVHGRDKQFHYNDQEVQSFTIEIPSTLPPILVFYIFETTTPRT